MTKEQIIHRGQAAAQLLDSGLFNDLTAAIDKECFDLWVNSNPSKPEDREDLYRMVQCHADYGRLLNAWKGDAQTEIHKIERAKTSPQL